MEMAELKRSMLKIIDDERAFWVALTAQGSSDLFDTPLNETWTLGSLAAHLHAWRSWGLDRLEAAVAGLPDPPPPYPDTIDDVDEANEFFRRRDASVSAESAVEAFSASFDRLRADVERLPDATLTDPRFFPHLDGRSLADWFADGGYFEHLHGEHADEIEAWKALTRGEANSVP